MAVQISMTPIKDSSGFVTNFVAVLQDVTERKASEAAFKLRDHALSNLNEVSACTTAVYHGSIKGCSQSDCRLHCPTDIAHASYCRCTSIPAQSVNFICMQKNACQFIYNSRAMGRA